MADRLPCPPCESPDSTNQPEGLITMARSDHASYTAAEKFERRANRRNRPAERRISNRRQIIAAALQEV